MKKGLLICSAVLALAVIITVIFIDFDEYTIEENKSEVEQALKHWLSRGDELHSPIVQDFFRIDDTNTYIAFFELENGHIGFAKLIEGWNGKLKIQNARYGSNVISYRPIETNKGHYAIFVGKNPESKIDHITKNYVNPDFNFTVKVEPGELFINYHALQAEALDSDDWSDYVLFDKNDRTIDLAEIYDLVSNQ